jgi:hypothetical protein
MRKIAWYYWESEAMQAIDTLERTKGGSYIIEKGIFDGKFWVYQTD